MPKVHTDKKTYRLLGKFAERQLRAGRLSSIKFCLYSFAIDERCDRLKLHRRSTIRRFLLYECLVAENGCLVLCLVISHRQSVQIVMIADDDWRFGPDVSPLAPKGSDLQWSMQGIKIQAKRVCQPGVSDTRRAYTYPLTCSTLKTSQPNVSAILWSEINFAGRIMLSHGTTSKTPINAHQTPTARGDDERKLTAHRMTRRERLRAYCRVKSRQVPA